MNRIYKSVWNAVTRSWTAVNEWTKSNKKKSSCIKSLTAGIALSMLIVPNSYATEHYGEVDRNVNDLIFGQATPYYDDGGLLQYTAYRVDGHDRYILDEVNTSRVLNLSSDNLLFSQSQGFIQELYSFEDLIMGLHANTYNFYISNSDQFLYKQAIQKSGTTVAEGFYALGTKAEQYFRNNSNKLGVTILEPEDDHGQLLFQGIQFSDTGINADENKDLTNSLALLTDINLLSDLQLSITSDSTLFAAIHAEGNQSIKYSGTENASGKPTLTLDSFDRSFDNDVSKYFNSSKSDYVGKTYFENLTVNLLSENVLGSTSEVNASNSLIKVSANTRAGNLVFSNNSVLNLGSNNQFDVFTSDATFDNTSEITGSNAKLNVENKLTVVKDSSGLTGEVTAKELELGAVNALGQANINVADKLTFNNVNSDEDFDNTVKATDGSFDLYALNSDVDIRSATLSAFQTTLQGTNTLVANIDQVGKKVTFNNLVADEYSTLKLQLDDQNSLKDVNLNSTFKNSIVELSGTGNDRIITVNSSNLANYAGWVRISEGTYDLNTTSSQNFNNQVGLSVGHNGTIKITGSDTVELDRFGWSLTAVDTDGAQGTLDLSDFDISLNTPALVVDELVLDSTGNVVIDYKDIEQLASNPQQGNLLDMDGGEDGKRFLAVGSNSNIGHTTAQLNPTFINKDSDDELLSIYNPDTAPDNQNEDTVAAYGTWAPSLITEYEANGADKAGLYVTFALTQVDLQGEDDAKRALRFTLADGIDNQFSAKITGNGMIDIVADATNQPDDKTIYISNEDNDFNGKVTVKDQITLQADAGALGNATKLELADGSSLMLNAISNKTQTLSGLTLSGNNSVELAENAKLDLALDTEAEVSGTTEFTGNGDLLVSKGKLSFASVHDSLANSSLTTEVKEGATLYLGSSSNDTWTINQLKGDGNLDVALKDAIWGDSGNFTGSVNLINESALTIDDSSELNSTLQAITLGKSTDLSFDYQNAGTQIQIGENTALKASADVAADSKANVTFNNAKGTLKLDDQSDADKIKLSLTGGSDVTINVAQSVFESSVGTDSVLTYKVTNAQTSPYQLSLDMLSSANDDGTLIMDFGSETDLAVTDVDEFNGTFGFRNAKFNLDSTDADLKTLMENTSIMVGSGSVLISDGANTLSKNLILEGGSTIDFTSQNQGSFNNQGVSVNAISMANDSSVTINGGAADIKFDTSNIKTSLIDEVDSTQQKSILDILTSSDDDPASVVTVITDIAYNGSAADLAGAFMLNGNFDEKDEIVHFYDQTDSVNPVADITIGLDIIASQKDDGKVDLGIGGAVKSVKIHKDKTLEIDLSQSTLSDIPTTTAKITGEGSIKVTGGNGDGSVDLVFGQADSSYTGQTIVTGDAHLEAVNTNALGNSSLVIGAEEGKGTVTISAKNGNTRQLLQGLNVQKGSALVLDSSDDKNVLVGVISEGDNRIDGALIAENSNSTLALGNQTALTISDQTDLSEFNGAFDLSYSDTASLNYEVQDGQTSSWNKSLKVNFGTNGGYLTKTGNGVLDMDIESLTNPNLKALEGTLNIASTDKIVNKLSVGSNGLVTIDGVLNVNHFEGQGGTVSLDLALGEVAKQARSQETTIAALGDKGDGLKIGTATGSAKLEVINTNAALNKGEVEKLHIVSIDDAHDFDGFSLAKPVTAGAYDYNLVTQDRQATGSGVETGQDIYLSSIVGDEDVRATTVTAGSYIGIAYAAQLFDVSLHDRVGNRDWINPVTGEKQSTSLWMRHSMSHERFRDSTSQLRMRSTSNVTMLGGDLVQYTTEGDGFAYAGLMGGYGTMDTKSRSKMTNLRSKSETDAWGVGAYAGWKANKDGQTGPYVDSWLMFTHASSDVTGVDRQEENIKGEGLSASIEAGWGFKLGSVETANGKYATFTVEPHASVTWFGMEYDDLHTDAQDVKFEGKNNVRTRLGTRVNMTEEGNKTFNAFAEANWVHNTQEYGATISGLTVDQTGSRNQAEGRIGVDWRITKDLSAWARVGASLGSDSYSEREGSIGVRYQF